jgi:hypothetical protein
MKKHKTSYTTVLGALFLAAACSFAGTVDAQISGGKEASASPAAAEPAAPAAPPSYRLIGTVGGKSFVGAVFDDPTGAQSFSRLYDKLPDGSQIVNVYDDRIALKRPDGSVFEMYTIHDTAKAAPSTKSPVSAGRSAPASAVSEDRRPERPVNAVRPPRMAPSAAQRAARNADDGGKRAGRGRRNMDAGVNAGGQGAADTRGPGTRNRNQ